MPQSLNNQGQQRPYPQGLQRFNPSQQSFTPAHKIGMKIEFLECRRHRSDRFQEPVHPQSIRHE